LKQLHTQNIPMAVATNKRLAPTQKLMDHFGWNDYFQMIECSDSQNEMRNKDAMIQEIKNQNQFFQEGYFIGDTVNDGLSANLNKLLFIKALYGYGQHQDWTNVNCYKEINKLSEIMELI